MVRHHVRPGVTVALVITAFNDSGHRDVFIGARILHSCYIHRLRDGS